MNRNHLIVLAVALLAAPLGTASVPPIKEYCEDPIVDWPFHKYYSGGTLNDKSLGTGETGIVIVNDGNVTGDCNGDTIPNDFDGHYDYGVGGGTLTAAEEYIEGCARERPHHGSSIHVEDRVLGFGVTFTVWADYFDLSGEPGCDGLGDVSVKCFGWCVPTFPPGSDGAYHVAVHHPATKGTITGV